MNRSFEEIAYLYDEEFSNSIIGGNQRKVVWEKLDKIFETNDIQSVLEINAGTGVDAIYIANKGCKIKTTDVAHAMLDIIKDKVYKASQEDRVRVEFLDLKKPDEIDFTEKYDLIFSNFGGLNCLNEEELKSWFGSCERLLNDDGLLLFVIMPKSTVVEFAYRRIKNEMKVYRQRFSADGLDVKVGENVFKTFYYNPLDVKELAKQFTVKGTKITGLFPSYLNDKVSKNRVYRLIYNLSEKFGKRLNLPAKYGDHFMIELKKTKRL